MMFYLALALALAVPTSILAWLYLRLELQLRTEDKICVRVLELVGDAAFVAFTDWADDRPFGIKAPSMDAFQSESIAGGLRE